MGDEKLKHLEFIQNIITRMSTNSFLLKGWAVTLVSGIFILSSKDSNKLFSLIAYIPIIVFWGLDAYYLLQERLYRSLYEKTRKVDEEKIDFSLEATKKEFHIKGNSWLSCFLSKIELWFYFPLAIICSGLIIIAGKYSGCL